MTFNIVIDNKFKLLLPAEIISDLDLDRADTLTLEYTKGSNSFTITKNKTINEDIPSPIATIISKPTEVEVPKTEPTEDRVAWVDGRLIHSKVKITNTKELLEEPYEVEDDKDIDDSRVGLPRFKDTDYISTIPKAFDLINVLNCSRCENKLDATCRFKVNGYLICNDCVKDLKGQLAYKLMFKEEEKN